MEDFMFLSSFIEISSFGSRYIQFSLELYICEILMDLVAKKMFHTPNEMLS